MRTKNPFAHAQSFLAHAHKTSIFGGVGGDMEIYITGMDRWMTLQQGLPILYGEWSGMDRWNILGWQLPILWR